MGRTQILNDGKKIPALAWGNGSSGLMNSPEWAVEIGTVAITTGIRHIDTAQLYETEGATGESIKRSGVPRHDIWVTSKLSSTSTTKTTADDVRRSVQQSIDALGFVPDLYLIHNPFVSDSTRLGDLWTHLEALVKDGTLHGCSLGFSNFRPQDIKEVMRVATIPPACHQLEYHPYVLEHLNPIQALHDKYAITTEAYSPLTPILRHPTGGPLKPVLEEIAERRGIDVGSVLLLWTMQKGAVVVTTSTRPKGIARLVALDELADLSPEDMSKIEDVGRTIHFRCRTEHMTQDFPAPDLPDGSL